jgi:hypothetical protein
MLPWATALLRWRSLARPIGRGWVLAAAISLCPFVALCTGWDPLTRYDLRGDNRSFQLYGEMLGVFVVALLIRDVVRRIAVRVLREGDAHTRVHARRMRLVTWGMVLVMVIGMFDPIAWTIFLVRHRAWESIAVAQLRDPAYYDGTHCTHAFHFRTSGSRLSTAPRSFAYAPEAPCRNFGSKRVHMWGNWWVIYR